LFGPNAKEVANRVAELCAVERVEVEVANAACIELAAQLSSDRRRNQLARRGQIVQPFEQVVEPLRNGCAATLGETTRGRDVRDWQDARDNLRLDPRRGSLVAEPEEGIRREEELRDRASRAGIDLTA